MNKSIKQLNKQLTNVEKQVYELAYSLQDLYQDYLPLLITIVKRQLTVATYHICIQKYPESFLALTYSQKSKLQETIKELGKEFPQELADSWRTIDVPPQTFLQQFHQQLLNNLFPLCINSTFIY